MICGWKIIFKRIEHSSFHDNQEYTFGENIPYWPRRQRSWRLGYKRMKKVFTNPFSNGCLDGCIRLGVKLAQYLSVKTNSFLVMRM
jgi:hypothetical protein